MSLDSQESERLWKLLGTLDERLAHLEDDISSLRLDVERFQKRSVLVSSKAGAKWGAVIAGAAIALTGVGQYLIAKANTVEVRR